MAVRRPGGEEAGLNGGVQTTGRLFRFEDDFR